MPHKENECKEFKRRECKEITKQECKTASKQVTDIIITIPHIVHHHHNQNQGLPHCDGASAKRGVCSGHKERMQRGIIINFILRMISDSKSWTMSIGHIIRIIIDIDHYQVGRKVCKDSIENERVCLLLLFANKDIKITARYQCVNCRFA